ncbi:toll-like receptor 7 [Tribolium castaneum]
MMRLHQFCLLLVVTTVSTSPTTPASSVKCIDGCECREQKPILRTTFEIFNCKTPFVLNKSALSNVPKDRAFIKFKSTDVQHITSDAFEDFTQLEEVDFDNSRVGTIDSEAFNRKFLGAISFKNVHFAEIPNLKADFLEEFICEDCHLSKVPNLDNLPSLTFINFANNRITSIHESALSKLKKLEEVNLSNNSISELPMNLFVQNEIDTLKLDYNPLKSFTFHDDNVLESLSLAHCNLTVFDENSTKNLTFLTSLDLSGNNIVVLPLDTFNPMKSLETIDLSDNHLVELDDNIFSENSRLDTINLNNNNLKKLPNFQTKAKLFQTSTFSCKNCGLKSATGLANMARLTKIDLSNNEITDIEGAFSEMPILKKLFLSNNHIASIGLKSPELETLDLSNNPLLPLDPVTFTALPSLKILNVSSCALEKIWSNYNAELPKLTQLYLGQNQLSVITLDDVKIMPRLKVIDLRENPWKCTDDLEEVVKYFVKESVYPADIGTIQFKTHEELTFAENTKLVLQPVWPKILPNCDFDFGEEEGTEPSVHIVENEQDEDDDFYDEDEYEENDEDEEIPVEKAMEDPSPFNLARATYILSITSVFILTAVLVSVVAIVLTLLILKRNKSFNMHTGNLPRLKIPLWHTTPGQKKHSGSVYRPLSEDLYGSRTPIINRYEFKQTPQVHNSLP